MNPFFRFVRSFQPLVERRDLLTLIVIVDVFAYFAGLIYWYGPVMADPFVPMWAWLFIPDCPLFGLLGALGLLMVIGGKRWDEATQERARRMVLGSGGLLTVLWLSTYLAAAPGWWQGQGAMLGVAAWVVLLSGWLFRRPPNWLLSIFAFGQILYGIWTVSVWLIFWYNTNALLGAPLFTFDSVLMTISHLGLIAQGIFLLTYFTPNRVGAGVAFLWFGLSAFMDYGLGYFPTIPEIIPLGLIQWGTITMTFVLAALFLVLDATKPGETSVSVDADNPQLATHKSR